MVEEQIKRFEELIKKLERFGKFQSKFSAYPFRKAQIIHEGLYELAHSINAVDSPKNKEELLQSELKRRVDAEVFNIGHLFSGKAYDFGSTIHAYGIPHSDIEKIPTWLKENRDTTIEAIERLFEKYDIQNFELFMQADIPQIRRQAEEFAAVHIHKYHKTLGKLVQDLTKVGEFLRDIDAVPTTNARSYFSMLTKRLAIGIPAVCYSTEDSALHLRERELIRLYGHEGMGHALHDVISATNDLPYFLTQGSLITRGTSESVAQFYQEKIFEDIKNSPETQKALGIQHIFDDIHTEAKDMAQLEEYSIKVFQFGIMLLADKQLGDPRDPEVIDKKIKMLNQYALSPTYSRGFIEDHRHSYDSQGNLNPGLVGELIYATQPVKRALEEFRKMGIKYGGEGRSIIDETLLTGYWSCQGFVDNARLRAEETMING